ncbi:MAG: VOC family protein [Clostridiales bacterium]|nr:VOC family protein [Clostridiales bacterium]
MAGYSTAFKALKIDQREFDSIISDNVSRIDIYECLTFCMTNVPELKEISSALLQYMVDKERNIDGGEGSGNWGHKVIIFYDPDGNLI